MKEEGKKSSKMACVSRKDLADRAPYCRFWVWYFCFYIGLPTLAVFCGIYAFSNPDDENCWYGERQIEKLDTSETVSSADGDDSEPKYEYVGCDIAKEQATLDASDCTHN